MSTLKMMANTGHNERIPKSTVMTESNKVLLFSLYTLSTSVYLRKAWGVFMVYLINAFGAKFYVT